MKFRLFFHIFFLAAILTTTGAECRGEDYKLLTVGLHYDSDVSGGVLSPADMVELSRSQEIEIGRAHV